MDRLNHRQIVKVGSGLYSRSRDERMPKQWPHGLGFTVFGAEDC